MKKVMFALLAIACFSFSQIKAQSKTPSEVAVGFMKSLINLNFKQAETFVRSDDSSKLAMAEPMINKQLSSMPDSVKQALGGIKCTASNEKISGDSATVDIAIASEKSLDTQGDKEKTKTVHLVKENGAWKAILDMNGGDSDNDDN